ncbi:unnamed protein product [Closterium sp. NIES-54]
MHSCLLVSGLPRSLPSLPRSPAPLCLPCVEGRQRAAPHSSEFPPTTAPLHTLHMDFWGPAPVGGTDQEHYFLLVVDDYTCYTTVFPLCCKADVSGVLIPWIRATRRQLRDRFSRDLPVLRLHSDRDGEFPSDLLVEFCRDEGIRQSFMLPASPQQNGIAGRCIDLIMEVARTSIIYAAAPHFLWSFAVRYASHQLNLWPRVSLPETSPTLHWTGQVGDASVFRVWGALSLVRDTTASKLSPCTLHCGPAPSAEGGDPDAGNTAATRRSTRLETPPGFPPRLSLSPPQPAAVDSGAEIAGAEVEGEGSGGAATGSAGSGGAETGGADSGGAASPGGGEESSPAGAGATSPRGAGGTAGGIRGAAGAGGTGGAGAGGAGATGPGVPASARGAGSAGGATSAGGTGAVGARVTGVVSAVGAGGAAGAAGAGGAGATTTGGTGGLAGTGGTGPAGALSHLLALPPAPTEFPRREPQTRASTPERRESETRASTPERREPQTRASVCSRVPCVRRSRAPPVPGTRASLPACADPPSDLARASSSTVTRFLATGACPPSVRGEVALGCDVLENRQEELECLAAAAPHLATMLLAPEGDPDALDIPTPCSYREEISGTYVDEVPPCGANIVSGMWIFRVKRPPGSPTPFKARYVARGFTQCDYELHSLDFSTAFLQGSLHEAIWLRHPPDFTGSFPEDTQWSLRRPVYGLHQAPRKWNDTLRTTLAALGFAPSTADPSLFLRTDTTLPSFCVLEYVDDLVFATADAEALALITRDRAQRTITLTQSHMVHQVLQCFGFKFSLPQPTPLSTGHSLSAPPSDDSVEPHVNDQETQRSTQGYTFSLGSGSVSWRSTRSSSVLGSSCEAEIYAGAMAAQELCWLTYLLTWGSGLVLLQFSASSAPSFLKALRANTADVFTNALGSGDHQRFCTAFGLQGDPAPLAADPTPADNDRYARERADVTAWKSRDVAACIALSSLLPESEETHFTQVCTASEFLTTIKARYTTLTNVSLGRLFLPFLFPDLASFECTADLITHLRSLDSSYHAACTDAQLALLPPPMAITIYFIATSLHDRLASVLDALLLKHPSELTIEVLESALKDVESNLRSVASASGVVPPPLFHGCTVPQLPTFTASLATAATDVTAAAVTTSSWSRGRSGRKGGQGAGGGDGGGGGEFHSGILVGFCHEQGIRQSWTLPESPQQNGVAECRIGLVMEIARISMTHARTPHFLWPYAVQYAAHQLNLWPRVSRPEVSPTSLWIGSPGAASRFRVWGCLALVRDTSVNKISPRAVPCVFLGFPEDSSDYTFYHPPLHRIFDSHDVRFVESDPYYVRYPCQGLPVPPAPLFLTSAPPPAPPV